MNDEELINAILEAVHAEPGISAHRLAKDLGLSLIEVFRALTALATDSGAIEGPAPLRLETRSDASLSTRVHLTKAGEALWISII